MTFAVVIFFLFAIVITFVLKKTKIGAYTYAVGGNEDAARLSGVRVERTKALIYGIGMLGTTLAALVMIGRLGTGDPSTGQGYEMDAIAAAANWWNLYGRWTRKYFWNSHWSSIVFCIKGRTGSNGR